jgi:hypothetical protein
LTMLLTGTYIQERRKTYRYVTCPVPPFNPPLSRRPFGQNYAFVVVAVIFLARPTRFEGVTSICKSTQSGEAVDDPLSI